MILRRTFRALVITLGICLLAGCASTGGSYSRKTYSSAYYLQMAANANGAEKQSYLLQAANRLIDERKARHAQAILQDTSDNLPPNLQVTKQLVAAKLLIAYNRNRSALNTLNAMNSDHSSWVSQDRVQWHLLSAKANRNLGNFDASIQQRSDVLALVPNDQRKMQTLGIWQSIENLSTAKIQGLLEQAESSVVKGWLTLALINEQSNTNQESLSQQLQQWKAEYPNHPAIALLPSSLRAIDNIPNNHPRNIALLLPLKGRYAKQANAIKNGFFAAYYNAKQQSRSPTNIIVINTSNKNIQTAYQEALEKGANFVVGPLTKSNITALVSSTKLSVPTLALNNPESLQDRSVNNLFQFGLSPVDEAQQAAMEAWKHHRHSALLISPNNNWGKTIVKSFKSTWTALGGQVITELSYNKKQNLSEEIRQLLNVDQAKINEVALKNTLRERLRFIPRRRKDIDVVFMVATPSEARQIRPLLQYYYAGNIPVFTISNVYAGHASAHRNHDLNGVIFPNMPWTSETPMKPNSLNAIREHVKQIWPRSYASTPKLYALGVDAYDIIPKINKMAMLPDLGTPAATGILYLDSNHHIYRKLQWSTIRNGAPHPIQ